jgi:hypothetical protein
VNNMDSNEYFEQKRILLKECVSISEEILSNITDIDTINKLLSARAEKITLLQKLEEEFQGKVIMRTLPDKQKAQINQLVALLLGLDRDTAKKIKSTQEDLKKSMKVNTQNHKLANYTGKFVQTSGRFLDKKK